MDKIIWREALSTDSDAIAMEHGVATTIVGAPFLLTFTENTVRRSSDTRARAVIYMECTLFALLHQYASSAHPPPFRRLRDRVWGMLGTGLGARLGTKLEVGL